VNRSLALVFDSDGRRRACVSAAVAADCTVHESAHISDLSIDARRVHPAVVIIGFAGEESGDVLAAIERLHSADRRLSVVLVTAGGSEDTAIAALRAGVKDYLREPLDGDTLAASVRRCLASDASRRPPRSTPRAETDPPDRFIGTVTGRRMAAPALDPLIGSAPALVTACAYLDRAAKTSATVLITGETGTGKELAARRVHHASGRPGRFVPVNCAAIPDALIESELFGYESGAFTGANRSREGLLQLANQGTIFLDEIADMGYPAQAKILRAIEQREVFRVGGRHPTPLDVRVVAATNQDLGQAAEAGRFRKDLYFRLNVVRVHLPPLRERRCDIPAIIDYYLRTLPHESAHSVDGFAPQTLEALVAYDWPGNVRELRNLIENVFVTAPAGRVRIEDLPPEYREQLTRYGGLPDAERARLMEALLAADWNKSRAAEMLRWSRMTLYRKMAKYSVVTSARPGRLTTNRR